MASLTTGVTLSDGWRFLSSSSRTQPVGVDDAVGGEEQADLDVAVLEGGDGERTAGVERLEVLERQAVGLFEALLAERALGALGRAAEHEGAGDGVAAAGAEPPAVVPVVPLPLPVLVLLPSLPQAASTATIARASAAARRVRVRWIMGLPFPSQWSGHVTDVSRAHDRSRGHRRRACEPPWSSRNGRTVGR